MSAKKSRKGNFVTESKAFKYFVPELGLAIKVEKAFYRTYVAHFPNGLERVELTDMQDWKCLGKWEE